MKNILFLVTGMTPQILTETLWALACDETNEEQWIPNEIHVLSTKRGIQQIKERIINSQVFINMQREYPQLRDTQLDNDLLEIISNKQGELDDIRTPDDNQVMADQLCEKIRGYCEDETVCLHVSIAGGRKTMGFYAGYALSLYGRAQDRLSHVLVEARFEPAIDFFYPTEGEKLVKNRDNKVVGDAQDARIWLAQIPFVRMQQAIKEKHQLKNSTDNFSQVVNKINESFNDVSIQLNVNNRHVIVNDSIHIDNMPPREFAMLHWFADLRKNNADKIGIYVPKKTNSVTIIDELSEEIDALSEDFLSYYEEHRNDEGVKITVDQNFFNEVKCRLRGLLEENLGIELAANIEIIQDGRGKPFYLNLHQDVITIVDSFSRKIPT